MKLGQLELGLEASFSRNIVLTTALVYDELSNSVGLGQLTVDFRLAGREAGGILHTDAVSSAGVVVGQFDVPFGLDWMVYPSVDRRTVTAPLAAEGVLEFWNDYGACVYLNHEQFNLTLFATDGAALGGSRTRLAGGGRLGIKGGEHFEAGVSRAEFRGRSGGKQLAVWGADFQADFRALQFKGEYLQRTTNENLISRGYYLQGLYDLGGCYLVCRAGQFNPGDDIDPAPTRFTAAVGFNLSGGFRLSIEQQFGRGLTAMTLAQLVYAF